VTAILIVQHIALSCVAVQCRTTPYAKYRRNFCVDDSASPYVHLRLLHLHLPDIVQVPFGKYRTVWFLPYVGYVNAAVKMNVFSYSVAVRTMPYVDVRCVIEA